MKITTTLLVWALTAMAASAQNALFESKEPSAPAQFAAVQAQIAAAPNGQYTIKLNRAFLKTGIYKNSMAPQDTGQEGDLLCLVLNRDLIPLDSILIKSPLRVRTEFPMDNGAIGSTILEYPTQELLIRFNFSAEMQHLRFIQFRSARNTTEITTIPLVFD